MPTLTQGLTVLLIGLLQLPTAFASQIPIVDGVIGGVSNTTGAGRVTEQTSSVDRTPGQLRVTENSGVCETTPGVYQASGYGDLTAEDSIFFWYFAARKDPDNAPLAFWFNGGPGSSSMIGLLQELGPCRINNESIGVDLNPFSWNNNANILFIDQPVGVGFSYTTGSLKVGTSQQAAVDVWKFLQIFFSDTRFAPLACRSLAIWTESYGGHYGPAFATYFLSQNDAIDAGTVTGVKLILQVLGIGDGLTDPLLQYPGYIQYAASNPYHPLVDDSVIARANASWSLNSTGCQARITDCYNNGTNVVCNNAQSFCNSNILNRLHGNWDVYYVPTTNPDPYPPPISDYLSNVSSQIGAESFWEESNLGVFSNFATTGDWMRNSRPDLEKVMDAGVRVLIYDGDADYILNYYGVEAMVDALQTYFTDLYHQQEFATYTINGQEVGLFKNAGTFSYIRLFGAGHEVPAYTYGSLAIGEAAFQVFSQIMANQSLSST